MSYDGAARQAPARQLAADILTPALKNRISTSQRETVKETDSKFANIKSNTFFSVLFDPNTKPEAKVDAVGKALTFEGTKEEMRSRVEEFETFKEYLQSVREQMSQEIIKTTDTEAMSVLQANYDQLNNALIDFDDAMKPLTDITDAVYTLRTNGVAHDAFKEIKDQKEEEAKIEAERLAVTAELEAVRRRIDTLNNDIAVLNQDTGWFGGLKKEAREQIAIKTLDLANARSDLSAVEARATEIVNRVSNNPSNLHEFSDQVSKLRELLDITSDEHKERSKLLVSKALNFVNTSKERIGSARDHLTKMGTQIENLGDSNGKMSMVFATLTEGIKKAEVNNSEIRGTLDPVENEDLITKMKREQRRSEIESHITLLDGSAADTMMTLGDLTSASIRIKTMNDAVRDQIRTARQMHSQGVAGVADRLSVVLQAVGAAALGESSAIAKDTLVKMTQNTNTIAQKESVRVAMGVNEVNLDIDRAIEDLAAYGEITKATTNITREGVQDMRLKLEELQNIARNVQVDVQEAIAVNADVFSGSKKEETATPVSSTPDPFKL